MHTVVSNLPMQSSKSGTICSAQEEEQAQGKHTSHWAILDA